LDRLLDLIGVDVDFEGAAASKKLDLLLAKPRDIDDALRSRRH
jgi:hypothetical protein